SLPAHSRESGNPAANLQSPRLWPLGPRLRGDERTSLALRKSERITLAAQASPCGTVLLLGGHHLGAFGHRMLHLGRLLDQSRIDLAFDKAINLAEIDVEAGGNK